jgi:hypothetical protein
VLEQDCWSRAAEAGHLEQDNWDRTKTTEMQPQLDSHGSYAHKNTVHARMQNWNADMHVDMFYTSINASKHLSK